MNPPPATHVQLSHRRPAALDRFWFGCAYYPEHWDELIRMQDPERMQQAGINVVRMAEFAWDLIEPREGKYDFRLFDETITHLSERGISTILCTPTAAPPRWLVLRRPDILHVNADALTMQHGSRQHCCLSHPVFREYSRRITTAMARHFAHTPHLVGWQTDNELYCHFSECHCDACQLAFRLFLRNRYHMIDKLNAAWGTAFWSQTVSSFEEIITPRSNKPTHANPAQQLDYHHFLCANVASFQHEQVRILRETNPAWFVFHNGMFDHVDYRGEFTKDLDFIGYDCYPLFQADTRKRRASQAFGCDRARGWSGNFIVPEQQSGPGGQFNYMQDTPEPGELRKMAYVSIAHGADSLLFFRWRTCRFGAEEYWCGVLDHDNVPRRRLAEVKQLGHEISLLGPELIGTSVHVHAAVATCDTDNVAAHDTLPLGLPSPNDTAAIIHENLHDRQLAVGCVHPADNLTGIRLYFLPHWVMIDPAWLPNLENFVRNGGILVIGARSGTRDLQNNVSPETPPGILRRLASVSVHEYGRQNDTHNRPLQLSCQKKTINSEFWYEKLQPDNARVFATWANRHLKGSAAITQHRIGKGCVYYVGTYLTQRILDVALPMWITEAELKPLHHGLPKDVELVVREMPRKRLWFFINHAARKIRITNPPQGINLMTSQRTGASLILESSDVAVIKTADNG